jgi:hypothetical protein
MDSRIGKEERGYSGRGRVGGAVGAVGAGVVDALQ